MGGCDELIVAGPRPGRVPPEKASIDSSRQVAVIGSGNAITGSSTANGLTAALTAQVAIPPLQTVRSGAGVAQTPPRYRLWQ
ncbi:MAG: hypothetical protein NTZ53_07730 [Cyanobacteria bacterium]|nr:hypothetical protein [Cyanobacteriota bacterium]